VKPTPQQEAIISAAPLRESLMVTAYAGCAKTTTLEMLAKALPTRPTLALAFNKRIQEELEKRLPDGFTVKTLNGLGHLALARGLGGRRLVVDQNKLGSLVTEVSKEMGYNRLSTEEWADVRGLVGGARQVGLVPDPNPWGRTLQPDMWDSWEEIADDKMIELTPELLDLARAVLTKSIRMALQGIVDFDDQIYISTLIAGRYDKYYQVLIDEAQDLSALNHLQLRKSVAEDGRLIVVGDPKQAIYAFRGADSKSMPRIRELRSDWIDLPLSLTFRCPRIVVERCKPHAPGFEAAPTNAEGMLLDLRQKEGWYWSEIPATGSIAIISRNNAPIISMALKLLAQLVPVNVLGRDIGKGLQALVKKICGSDPDLDSATCLELIDQWASREIANAQAKGKEEKVAGIVDRQESLTAVIEAGNAHTLGAILSLLNELFNDRAAQVTLSTGHKAKGLEWHTVVHLDPWRIPSKFAKRANDEGNPITMEQDLNLRYVIETRAQDTLVLADLQKFMGLRPENGATTDPQKG
jgi:DNA helicase-2/ATP-dependent DNA helicase PcrA